MQLGYESNVVGKQRQYSCIAQSTTITKEALGLKSQRAFLIDHQHVVYLTMILNFVRVRSRLEELERVQFFSHLITIFLPLRM